MTIADGPARFMRLATLILGGAALAGCGDDGTASDAAAPADAGPADAAHDSGSPRDAGPSDAANSGRIDADGLRGFNDLVEECRMGCSASMMLHECVAGCIDYQVEGALSAACADCYAAAMVCTVETGCSTACDSSDPSACDACRCGYEPMTRNCGQEVWDCAGVGVFCPIHMGPSGDACVNESDQWVLSRLWYTRPPPCR